MTAVTGWLDHIQLFLTCHMILHPCITYSGHHVTWSWASCHMILHPCITYSVHYYDHPVTWSCTHVSRTLGTMTIQSHDPAIMYHVLWALLSIMTHDPAPMYHVLWAPWPSCHMILHPRITYSVHYYDHHDTWSRITYSGHYLSSFVSPNKWCFEWFNYPKGAEQSMFFQCPNAVVTNTLEMAGCDYQSAGTHHM